MVATSSDQMLAGPSAPAMPPESTESQHYTFSFEATPVPKFMGQMKDMNMVSEVLLGMPKKTDKRGGRAEGPLPPGSDDESKDAAKQGSKDVTPSNSVQSSLPTDTPPSSRETRSDGRAAIESDIRRDAIGRCYPEFYVMKTTPAIHASASRIVDSSECTVVFERINAAVDEEGQHESTMVKDICALSEIVRTKSGAGRSEYGKFVARGHQQVRNPSVYDLVVDSEVNKVDIFIQESEPQASARADGFFYWSNALSFVEVKAKDSFAWKDPTIKQSVRYARKVLQYRSVLSHLHFVTWCGHTVHLWYINASLYGCSRPLDTRVRVDQIEIIKIVQLLSLKKYSDLVCSRWDVTARRFSIEQDGKTDRKVVDVEALRPLAIRPGPFRSRTAVYADAVEDDEGRVYMLKLSWVAEHLTRHELTTLRDIQEDFGKDLETHLPFFPIPIGLAKPPAGFPCTTSEMTTASSAAPEFPPRELCALMTKQHIGDYIGTQVRPHGLVSIHRQLADVLFKLAGKGYHYRDLNDGNVRVLHGTTDTLYLADFGNVSKDLSRRGHRGESDAAATIDRAKDDTRSGTPLFVPCCYAIAKVASDEWDYVVDMAIKKAAELSLAQSQLSSEFPAAVVGGRKTGNRLDPVVDAILEQMEDLHTVLRESNVYAHRYIDDLEGALYLHLWSMALGRGLDKAGQAQLSRELRTNKAKIWGTVSGLDKLMESYCGLTGTVWKELMHALRKVVRDARTKLTADLSKPFEDNGVASLEALEKEVEQWRSAKIDHMGTDADATRMIINSLWQNKGILPDDKQKLQKIEEDCFLKCIALLQKAEDRLQLPPGTNNEEKRHGG